MSKIRATHSDIRGVVVAPRAGTFNVRISQAPKNTAFLYPTAHAHVVDTVRSMNIFGTMSGVRATIDRGGISDDWKRVGDDIKAASALILKGRDGERKRA